MVRAVVSNSGSGPLGKTIYPQLREIHDAYTPLHSAPALERLLVAPESFLESEIQGQLRQGVRELPREISRMLRIHEPDCRWGKSGLSATASLISAATLWVCLSNDIICKILGRHPVAFVPTCVPGNGTNLKVSLTASQPYSECTLTARTFRVNTPPEFHVDVFVSKLFKQFGTAGVCVTIHGATNPAVSHGAEKLLASHQQSFTSTKGGNRQYDTAWGELTWMVGHYLKGSSSPAGLPNFIPSRGANGMRTRWEIVSNLMLFVKANYSVQSWT